MHKNANPDLTREHIDVPLNAEQKLIRKICMGNTAKYKVIARQPCAATRDTEDLHEVLHRRPRVG